MSTDSTTEPKRCPACKNKHPRTSEFWCRNKSTKDGLHNYCKDCHKKSNKKTIQKRIDAGLPAYDPVYHKDYYERNKVKLLADMKKWREDNRDKWLMSNRQRVKDWQKKNPEKVSEQRRRQRKRKLDSGDPVYILKQKTQARKWQLENPEKNRAKALRHIARKKGAEGSHTVDDVALIYKSQCGKCWWCGRNLNGKFEVDHRIPLSRGGSDNPDNLCVSCKSCNCSKKDKMPWEWNGRLL